MLVKSDLHLHAAGDPLDTYIEHSPTELIDCAAQLKFGILSITFHAKQHYPQAMVKYASKKGILLIPGTEWFIEGKHTLLYNFSLSSLKRIKTFADLRREKTYKNLVIAPHPFYPHPHRISLQEKVVENIDVFDFEISEEDMAVLDALNEGLHVRADPTNFE